MAFAAPGRYFAFSAMCRQILLGCAARKYVLIRKSGQIRENRVLREMRHHARLNLRIIQPREGFPFLHDKRRPNLAPHSVRIGMFCKFGSLRLSRPVAAVVSKKGSCAAVPVSRHESVSAARPHTWILSFEISRYSMILLATHARRHLLQDILAVDRSFRAHRRLQFVWNKFFRKLCGAS